MLEKCVHVHVHDMCMHVYTQILELSWEICGTNACLSLSLSLSLSLTLSPRLLQHKFFIRANKVEVKPKSDEQTTASSSKESESSSLRKRGEKATDSPRAKKVNQWLLIFNVLCACLGDMMDDVENNLQSQIMHVRTIGMSYKSQSYLSRRQYLVICAYWWLYNKPVHAHTDSTTY